MRRGERGFTLIEVLVVIAIVALITAAAIDINSPRLNLGDLIFPEVPTKADNPAFSRIFDKLLVTARELFSVDLSKFSRSSIPSRKISC